MSYYSDDTVTLHHGDSLDVLRTLDAGSVDCCVTSPPYFGLRDYGMPGQIGAEKTPAEFVERLRVLFAEVRRVLADDGTMWLNLGDSYARNPGKGFSGTPNGRNVAAMGYGGGSLGGLPGKNLLGIPWQVARALQGPQYVGKIRDVADRAWLAGWIDGEGTISYVERDRGPDHTVTHDIRVFVTNCDDAPLRAFADICGGRVNVHDDGTRENRYGKRVVYRWQMGTHDSALVLREVYPYLRTKRKQAALIWTLFTTLRHQNGHARTPLAVVARRKEIAAMVRTLNTGVDVTLPDWVVEPPTAEEPGWILRNAIIWSKPNAMPESVTDRLSTRYEMLFMFSKSRRYWFDLDPIRDSYSPNTESFVAMKSKWQGNQIGTVGNQPHAGNPGLVTQSMNPAGKNPGDVWTIPTAPFPGSHFAVFPPELPRRCIAAGCKPGGTVLDPFHGSGTTGMVATRNGRKYVGIELNEEYLDLSLRTRLADGVLDFNGGAA